MHRYIIWTAKMSLVKPEQMWKILHSLTDWLIQKSVVTRTSINTSFSSFSLCNVRASRTVTMLFPLTKHFWGLKDEKDTFSSWASSSDEFPPLFGLGGVFNRQTNNLCDGSWSFPCWPSRDSQLRNSKNHKLNNLTHHFMYGDNYVFIY